jgi:terminase small subunit-like protein
MSAKRKNPPEDILEIIERIVAGEGGSTKILARAIGVSDSLVRAWFDREEDLREVYEAAREAHMHSLYLELLQMSRTGKGNAAGIIYTLKSKFKMFDQPGSGKLVDVNVTQVNPVMIVRDHGDDAQWAAKAEEQQRRLIADNEHTPLLEASTAHQVDAVASFAPVIEPAPIAPSWIAPVAAVPYFGPPVFNWKAKPVGTPTSAPDPIRSAPVAPVAAPVWRSRA